MINLFITVSDVEYQLCPYYKTELHYFAWYQWPTSSANIENWESVKNQWCNNSKNENRKCSFVEYSLFF